MVLILGEKSFQAKEQPEHSPKTCEGLVWPRGSSKAQRKGLSGEEETGLETWWVTVWGLVGHRKDLAPWSKM